APFHGESTGNGNGNGNGAAEPGFTIDLDRLGRRQALLEELDSWRRSFEADASVSGLDACSRRAFDILTSRRLFEALDVTREDPRLRAKYGVGDMTHEADGPPCCNDHFLMARRLVEAGVRCVTISFGRWDTHSDNFRSNARRMPKLDAALS